MTNETRDPHAPCERRRSQYARSIGAAGAGNACHRVRPPRRDAWTGPQGGAPGAVNEPSPVQALEAQVADLKDQVLRAYAEMENVRKRGERERQDTQKYAVSKFARDVLSVADNLERAIAAAPATETADPVLKGLFEGVTVTERALVGILERHGVERIDALGAQFDPHQHQAVMEQPDPTLPSGTIVRVFEAGYMIGDRVLRPASVVVAKGAHRRPLGPRTLRMQPQRTAMPSDAGNDNAANGGSSEPSAGA